jgi:hypothetical protein
MSATGAFTVGASLTLPTVTLNTSEALSPKGSAAVTLISTAPTSLLAGVPEKVRAAGSKAEPGRKRGAVGQSRRVDELVPVRVGEGSRRELEGKHLVLARGGVRHVVRHGGPGVEQMLAGEDAVLELEQLHVADVSVPSVPTGPARRMAPSSCRVAV